MTDSRSDARRIVTQCLLEAARGPDEAKAAAARAEMEYRHKLASENFRKAFQSLVNAVRPALEAIRRFSYILSVSNKEEQDGELGGISAGGSRQDGRGSG